MAKGKTAVEGRITGRLIIEQLVRNMELGQFEMGYSILLPCIFSLYLHPDDYARLAGVLDLIKEDAKRALAAKLEQVKAKPVGVWVVVANKDRKVYKIGGRDWAFEFFPDSEGVVPVGDVEIHSELNEIPQPGYHGVKTTLMGREPSAGTTTGQNTTGQSPVANVETRKPVERVHAEIRYEDDSGPQLFRMTQAEISTGPDV